ncbi:hypothetical protein, partial [Neptunicoccus sediminis]|uniref:hypothetical protein n=1 Tax=Neptunicoccus sediminis TaxID=1892596 RepID=UPI001C12BF92
SSGVGKNQCRAHHPGSRPHDKSPVIDPLLQNGTGCSLQNPARLDCACRHRSGPSGAFAPSPSVLLEQSKGGSVASHAISRTQIQWLPQASAHFPHSLIQDPRGFLLPRFVNAGRHRRMATGAPRPASKNLQDSGLSLQSKPMSALRRKLKLPTPKLHPATLFPKQA